MALGDPRARLLEGPRRSQVQSGIFKDGAPGSASASAIERTEPGEDR